MIGLLSNGVSTFSISVSDVSESVKALKSSVNEITFPR